jgi:hypothetical protein
MTPADVILSRFLRWRAVTTASVICLALGASLAALAQDSSLSAERVVNYASGKTLPLSAKVGPVSIQSVEFTDRGRGSSRGGLASVVGRGSVSETSTTIRSHFLGENPSTDEWEVTFTLEFLDKSGKLIDKATKKSTWQGEAKPFDFDHPILQYVVPSIAQVRIRLEGRLD